MNILEATWAESHDIEAEARRRHQPREHLGIPCPSGTCCTCGASGCEVGTVLKILEDTRAQFIKHRTTTHKVDPKECLTCKESDIVLGISS